MTDYDFDGKRVFLSGPVTGLPEWNRPAFDEAAEWLRDQGAKSVFNLADLSPNDDEEPYSHEAHMLLTLHALTACEYDRNSLQGPRYDAIALLPGWRESEGASAEELVAESIGLDVAELGGAL